MATQDEIRAKDILPHKTSFASGDGFYGDGDSSFFMKADNLLELTAQNALAGNVAPAFDQTKPDGDDGFAYHCGDIVTYNGIVYGFVVNKTSGAWDASKVEAVGVEKLLSRNDTLFDIVGNIYSQKIAVEAFEQGNISTSGVFVDSTNRIRSHVYMAIYDEILVSTPFGMKWRVLFFTQDGLLSPPVFIDTESSSEWQFGAKKVAVPATATSFRVVLANAANSDLTPSNANVYLVGKKNNSFGFSELLPPVGTIGPIVSTTRITSMMYKVPSSQRISVRPKNGYQYRVLAFSAMNYESKIIPSDYDSNWHTENAVIDFRDFTNALYFVVVISKTDSSTISDADSINVSFFPTTRNEDGGNFEGKIISILGDSISTFGGSASDPDSSRYAQVGDPTYPGNRCRYPQTNLLTNVDDTYWMRLIKTFGLVLGINESWAGSRVSNTSATDTGDVGPNRCISSMTRIGHLDDNGTPNIILVNAGTNDIGNNVTLGTFNYDDPSNYTDAQIASLDVSTFADAYRAMLIRLQKTYPSARIIIMLPNYTTSYYNPQKEDQYCEVVKEACDYFGVPYVDMRTAGITMFNRSSYLPDGIHYNASGMALIYEKVKLGFEMNL